MTLPYASRGPNFRGRLNGPYRGTYGGGYGDRFTLTRVLLRESREVFPGLEGVKERPPLLLHPQRVDTDRIHDSMSKSKPVGKLALFYDNWQKFWMLFSGYIIEFVENPHQTSVPSEISFNDEMRSVVDNEVVQLLQKGAIVPSIYEKNEFISNLFVVPKPNGKWRPILN